MALSGTFKNNFKTGYGLELDWSATQNIANNQSTITAKLYWCSYGSSYTVSSSATKTAWLAIGNSGWQSTSSAGLASLSGNQRKLIYTYSYTVTHASDGTCSASIAGEFDCEVTLGGTYYADVKVSGTAYLDTIPRASTISSTVDWTPGVTNLTVTLGVASSSFTHDIRLQIQRPSDNQWITVASATGIGQSYTWSFTTAEITAMYQALGGYENRPSWLGVTTKSGTTKIGSEQGKYGTVYGHTPATISFSDFDIGTKSIPATLSNYNSNFTYTATFSFEGWTKSATIPLTSANPTLTLLDADVTSMYNAIPTKNSGVGNVYVSTKYNGVEINDGTPVNQNKSFIAYVKNSNPTFTGGFTYRDYNTTTNTIKGVGNEVYIIQNYSKVIVELPSANRAIAINGADMTSNGAKYTATLNGETVDASWSSSATVSFDFDTIDASADTTLVVKARDSRGNETSVPLTVKVIPYSPPVISATATRLNGFGTSVTLSCSGTVTSIKISSSEKNAVLASGVTYKWRVKGGAYNLATQFGAVTGTIPNYSVPNASLTFANTSTYEIEVSVADKLSTTIRTITVTSSQPVFFIDEGMKSVAVNGLPSTPNAFEVTGVFSVSGNINVKGFDFTLGSGDQSTRGNSGASRAMIKDSGNKLVINYGGDFSGGTKVNSDLEITGSLNLSTTTYQQYGTTFQFQGGTNNNYAVQMWVNTDNRFIIAPNINGTWDWNQEFGFDPNNSRWYVDSNLYVGNNITSDGGMYATGIINGRGISATGSRYTGWAGWNISYSINNGSQGAFINETGGVGLGFHSNKTLYIGNWQDQKYFAEISSTDFKINATGSGYFKIYNQSSALSTAWWDNGTQSGFSYWQSAWFTYHYSNGRFEAHDYNGTGWKNICALGFPTSSSKKWKRNITDYSNSAKDIIKSAKIRHYNMEEKYEDQRRKIGLVAEEAPAEVLDTTGEMVDLYPMATLAWKAIQELSEEVEYLKSKLKNR